MINPTDGGYGQRTESDAAKNIGDVIDSMEDNFRETRVRYEFLRMMLSTMPANVGPKRQFLGALVAKIEASHIQWIAEIKAFKKENHL